jgi:hypothetical protein
MIKILIADDFRILAPGDIGQDHGEFIARDSGRRLQFAYVRLHAVVSVP